MGTIFARYKNSESPQSRRTWPVRYFHQITSTEDMQASRFSRWDPRMNASHSKYPAKETAKDF